MPHTWCGSDFLNAARAMFIYEADKKLVLFAGVPDQWFAEPGGVTFDGLLTEYGAVSAAAHADGPDRLIIRVQGQAHPPGGFELPSPLPRPIRLARVNGQPVKLDIGNRLIFPALPAEIELHY
jgi:hypothetical protein